MPFCPNPNCPHRKRFGEPAEFSKGVATCSDCGGPLSEIAPNSEPLTKSKAVTGWKCPECGSLNRYDIALCLCGYNSNKPAVVVGEQKAKSPEVKVPSSLEGPQYRRTRKWLIFFGVIELLMGAVAALNLLLWLFMLLFLPSSKEATIPWLDKNTMAMFVAMFGAGALFFTWIGIGSLLTRRWARAIMIVVSGYWFVIGSLGYIMTLVGTRGYPSSGSSVTEKAYANSGSRWNIYMVIMLIILPMIFFLFYRSKNVKATCEQKDPVTRWTDRFPLPVLAVLLLLGSTSIGYLLSSFSSNHIFSFGRMIIKGYPAFIVTIAKVGIYAYLTIAIYKMKRSGWIATMIVTFLDFGIQSLSFFFVNESDYLSSMGYSESQIQQMKSIVAAGSDRRMALLWTGLLLIWMGFLLYLGKYFKPGLKQA